MEFATFSKKITDLEKNVKSFDETNLELTGKTA